MIRVFGLSKNLSNPVYWNTVLTAVSLAIGGKGSENALLFAQRRHSARCTPIVKV